MQRVSPRSDQPARPPSRLDQYPHAAAFSIQIARNLIVQGSALSMISLIGLSVASWPAVLAWTVVAVAAVVTENRLLGLIARDSPLSPAARRWAPAARVLTTSVYAAAAFVLLVRGGLGERFFAFALMSASMVSVLMRYYRSPLVLAAGVSPYVVVVGLVGLEWARAALAQGRWLEALACGFTLAMFGVQLWSARAQLSGAWMELATAREAAEERERAAEAANRAKSQFLATMSHELRTPLNGVLGIAQALAGDGLTRLQQRRVALIRRSSQTLLGVLDDILDLSMIETGSLELDPGEVELEFLVRGVAAVFQPQARKKGLSFSVEIAPKARGLYRGDAARIRRALHSLCDNAVKFTDAGGVALRVRRDGTRTVFTVTDTGIGIAEADLERLFEGFFQVDASNARRHGGAGVGLAICRELTALMGGTVVAASRPGAGSTFTLALPLQRIRVAPKAKAARADPPRASALRILAAEDNATNQMVLKAFLAPAGIAPTLVVNGREAVAAWEEQAWDLVLMDIQMPEMDGIAATRAIRERERETGRPRTPILAVTANAMTHQVAEYEAAGMDGVVAKPLDVATLFRTMEQALTPAAA